MTEGLRESIVSYRDSSLKYAEIAKILSCSPKTVSKYLRYEGVSRACSKKESLVGRTKGKLTVINLLEERKGTQRLWLCQCECGSFTKRTTGEFNSRAGHSSMSCGCTLLVEGSQNPHWKGFGDISSTYWSRTKFRAESKKFEFSLTIEEAWYIFLAQEGLCNLSGIPIKLGSPSKTTASLDRIDNSKGYLEGNVQWVHKDINRMKNVHDQSYFIELCKAVAKRE